MIKISDMANSLQISSRTLRYYEQVGILQSIRFEDKQQRYYDDNAVERIKQIHVLRKMQIPIKDIIHIFQSEDMIVLIEAFTQKINSIDSEISSLGELRGIIDHFLQRMIENGISRISVIPLLYDVAVKQLEAINEKEKRSMERLVQIEKNLSRMDELNDIRICELPDMRALSSIIKNGEGEIIDDMGEGMRTWAIARGIPSRLGMRESFAYFDPQLSTFVMLQYIPDDFSNDSPYPDTFIKGGLEAVVSGERDHLVARYEIVMQWIEKSDRYELDIVDGQQRHPALCDWLTPKEIHQKYDFEQQDIFIPIRARR